MNKYARILALSLLVSAPNAFVMAHPGAAARSIRSVYWLLTVAPLVNNLPNMLTFNAKNGSKTASTAFSVDKGKAPYAAAPVVSHFASMGVLSAMFSKTYPVCVPLAWRVPCGLANCASNYWLYGKLPGNNPNKTFTSYLAKKFSK